MQFLRSPDLIAQMSIDAKSGQPQAFPVYENLAYLSEVVMHTTVGRMVDAVRRCGLTYEFGLWIFAMLLVVEKPLVPDVNAEINDLMGYVIEFQETLYATKEKNASLDAICNIIIVIIAEYFGQKL
ncbi:MAG: hypothetical protein P4M11_03335 [Candidatus Pacebacteria bacterium]|nr:hypothetical protein [Candidatus Paceibacterota bacterium]